MHIKLVETILFVNNQKISAQFYANILRINPNLDVPGMTEFTISGNCKIGLMPNQGIAKILSDKIMNPSLGIGIPRCELYLYVDNVESEYQNAINHGAKLVSPIAIRDWGDKVCYFSDPDGHIIAFAEQIKPH